jgi:hypothetical protein
MFSAVIDSAMADLKSLISGQKSKKKKSRPKPQFQNPNRFAYAYNRQTMAPPPPPSRFPLYQQQISRYLQNDPNGRKYQPFQNNNISTINNNKVNLRFLKSIISDKIFFELPLKEKLNLQNKCYFEK